MANLSIPALRVFLGERDARVIYSGRSGCCAGMDLVILEVPAGIEGCNVPVRVRYGDEGETSNDAFVSVASGAGACSDPHGLTEAEVRKADSGALRGALILALDPPGWDLAFGKSTGSGVIPFGTCTTSWMPRSPLNMLPEDVGTSVRIITPRGVLDAPRRDGNIYSTAGGTVEPGNYAISSSGRFEASFSIPASDFVWTNSGMVETTWNDGLTVTWTGGDSAQGYVSINGVFGSGGETTGDWFFACNERADQGRFTLPSAFFQQFRAGHAYAPDDLALNVQYDFSKRIEVPGFDVGQFTSFQGGLSPYKQIRIK